MFLTGPKVVREALGEDVTMEELGGPEVQGANGVCQLVAAEERRGGRAGARPARLPARVASARRAADRGLPDRGGDPARRVPAGAPPGLRHARGDRPRSSTAAARSSCRSAGRANMVTALARIEGRPVGVVANQPRRLGGVIDAAAAEKAARSSTRATASAAAGGSRRHPGLHARAPPGARRRDPPRRRPAAGVRRRRPSRS